MSGSIVQDVVISEAEWLAELDRLRSPMSTSGIGLTEEQYQAIRYARESDRPVPWDRLVKFWQDHGWGKRSRSWITGRYEEERDRRTAQGEKGGE